VASVMDGLKGDVPVGPETEDHAERRPEWDQAKEQKQCCDQSSKYRHV